MRIGTEDKFDTNKMVPGEWAVSTDKKYVRMCFSPGVVARMATYEAFEEDMTEIQTILATCQNIRVAVEAFEKLAEQHASQAEIWSVASKSWAVGGTGTRNREDTNNSKYWSQQAKSEADRAKSEADRAASIADFDPDNYFSFSGGTEIQSDEDLNNITNVGNYFCRIDQAVKTLLNCPVTKVFNMKVFYGTGNFILTQMIRCYDGEILFRYQKGNGEWQSWEHTYEPMKGATASVAGKEGLAPAPVAGKQNAYLRGDGTWVAPSINLLGTVPGIPLDATMGKQLKDEINGLITSLKTTKNAKITFYDGVINKNNSTYVFYNNFIALLNICIDINISAFPPDNFLPLFDIEDFVISRQQNFRIGTNWRSFSAKPNGNRTTVYAYVSNIISESHGFQMAVLI